MTEKVGAKKKPAGETVKGITIYIKEIEVIQLGGAVRIRKILKETIQNLLK
jgi:hypothetical protein